MMTQRRRQPTNVNDSNNTIWRSHIEQYSDRRLDDDSLPIVFTRFSDIQRVQRKLLFELGVCPEFLAWLRICGV